MERSGNGALHILFFAVVSKVSKWKHWPAYLLFKLFF